MNDGWTVQVWGGRSAFSAALAAACEEVGASLIYRAEPSDASLPRPALLAAVLPAGERSLAADLVEQLDADTDLCLLLLCEEVLVRPTLSIQQGRIVLLDAPLTASRIGARLRLLMTPRCAESPGKWLPAGAPPAAAPSSVAQQRFRTASCWFAVFTGAAPARGCAARWRSHARHGLSWALSDAEPDAAAAAAWVASPASSAEDVELERSSSALLGVGAALVQLDPNARQWRFLLPMEGSLLRVYSHQRLPRAWNAGRAQASAKTPLFRLAAAPGDVVCVTTAALLDLESTLERSALDGGGPALFQTLITHCPSAALPPVAGVVVEVL
jgi:hypothetical protein